MHVYNITVITNVQKNPYSTTTMLTQSDRTTWNMGKEIKEHLHNSTYYLKKEKKKNANLFSD